MEECFGEQNGFVKQPSQSDDNTAISRKKKQLLDLWQIGKPDLTMLLLTSDRATGVDFC